MEESASQKFIRTEILGITTDDDYNPVVLEVLVDLRGARQTIQRLSDGTPQQRLNAIKAIDTAIFWAEILTK